MPLDASVTASYGTYRNGQLCFTADTSGTYVIDVTAEAECGSDECQLTFVIDQGPVAEIDCPDIIEPYTICDPIEICYGLSIIPLDASIELSYGEYRDGQVCFTADTAGLYTIEVTATAECGSDVCTLEFPVEIGESAEIECPVEPIAYTICEPTEFCYDLAILPLDAVVTVSYGTYRNGQLCFMADTAGTYLIDVGAEALCGGDDCTLEFVITYGDIADIECPAGPVDLAICEATELCYDLAILPLDAAVTVSYGTYRNGQLCFMADTAGTYVIDINAEAECGGDDCRITFVVEMLESIDLVCPGDITLFICEPDTLCFDIEGIPDDATIEVFPPSAYFDYENDRLCFYTNCSVNKDLRIIATNACGSDTCDFTAYVTMNSAPLVILAPDTALSVCTIEEIAIPAGLSDVDNNITVINVLPSGSYSDITGRLYFTPPGPGDHWVYLEAVDECDAIDIDSVLISVTLNSAPTVEAGPDIDTLLCAFDEICFPVDVADIDKNIESVSVIPVGVFDSENGIVCFTPTAEGTYRIITTAVDSCGLSDADTVFVTVTLGDVAIIDCPDEPFSNFLCEPETICIDLAVTPLDATVTTSFGTYQDGQLCFMADTSGTYLIDVEAEAECGSDRCTVEVVVEIGEAAQIECPPDPYDIFLCEAIEICRDLVITPVDATVSVSYGSYVNGQICFPADTSGTYVINITAESACGSDDCTLVFNVEIGEAAEIDCPTEPFSEFLCEATELCFDLAVTPVDAAMTVSYGTYYDGRVCFMADTSGTYTIDITAESACGSDQCTIVYNVEIGEAPVIDCPSEPLSEFLCEPGLVCYDLPISPLDAQVSVDFGIYEDGRLCFYADTSGYYKINVIAVTDCGRDSCMVESDIEIGQAPVLTCPDDATIFLCGPTEVCLPLGVLPANAEITVDPVGTYDDGQICFTPDTEGDTEFTVTATNECGQTTCNFTVTIDFNEAPTVTAADDTTYFQCDFEEICRTVYIADADGNFDHVTVTQGGYYDAENDLVCFTPPMAGIYTLIIRAYDDCDAIGADTMTITVTTGDIAEIECPAEPFDELLCVAGEVCVPLTITPAAATVSVSNGTWADNELCFQADTAGTYVVTVIAAEACGSDTCEVTVNVTFGGYAEITCPDLPISSTLCDPDLVYVTLPISPPTAVVTVLPFGDYDFATGRMSIYADTSGQYDITVLAEAPCGNDECTVQINVDIIDSPQLTCPGDIDTVVCIPQTDEICFDIELVATDAEVTVSPRGSYSGGMVCIPINGPEAIDVTVVAENLCGDDTCELTLTVGENLAPQLTVPDDILIPACSDDIGEVCVSGIFAVDPEGDALTITKVCGPGEFIPDRPDSGQVCFTPESNDITYDFCIEATDGCQTVADTFQVTVYPSNVCETCLDISIETDSCYVVGSNVPIHITAEAFESIGGYDLLVSFDASVMAFLSAQLGDAIPNWEYFTYNLESTTTAPSGLLRMVAIADQANGPVHPPVEQLTPYGELARINIRLSFDQNVGGQFLPINFYWMDCGDNGFSDPTGSLLYVDALIYDAFGSVLWDESNEDLYPESSRPTWLGAPDSCLEGGKQTPIRCVTFHNGGICVTHPDSIDARGDLNLNGVVYEIADAVVYTNYFIYGFSAFQINVNGQTAASDVNADGMALTVADLVYLIRVITGDATPTPKLAPEGSRVHLQASENDGLLSVEADLGFPVGAGLLVFEYDGVTPQAPELGDIAAGMEIAYAIDDNEIRVLIYSFERGGMIDRSLGEIISFNYHGRGEIRLTEAAFAGYHGEQLKVELGNSLVPTEFELSQNYPNPFNPTTRIDLSLPTACCWELAIYNAAGQCVNKFDGRGDPGVTTVVWDGTNMNGADVASGIYFYRVKAGAYSATRKMILLK